MKLSGRKVTAYVVTTLILCVMYFITLFIYPDVIEHVGTILVIMIFATSITFIGGNTLDKWIKSKYFRSEFFDKD